MLKEYYVANCSAAIKLLLRRTLVGLDVWGADGIVSVGGTHTDREIGCCKAQLNNGDIASN